MQIGGLITLLLATVYVSAAPVWQNPIPSPPAEAQGSESKEIRALNTNFETHGLRSYVWISSNREQEVWAYAYIEQDVDLLDPNSEYISTITVCSEAGVYLNAVLADILLQLETTSDSPDDPEWVKEPITLEVASTNTRVKVRKNPTMSPSVQKYILDANTEQLVRDKPEIIEEYLSQKMHTVFSSQLFYVDRNLRMVHFDGKIMSVKLDSHSNFHLNQADKRELQLFRDLNIGLTKLRLSFTELCPLSPSQNALPKSERSNTLKLIPSNLMRPFISDHPVLFSLGASFLIIAAFVYICRQIDTWIPNDHPIMLPNSSV
ncbi:unnamed protein product [Kuraishia capsulata CBS 1993]|uniref:Protein BIG1 n=1 Tax=Kuraishia capsulata CBS 1993 TaxID=1382522 RepID=W6MWV4_9ASCO|nr:uncharacterized protein KUCA_T00003900001 [Kuraishia capsulata CBS 1993]CDK27920.1 unnamed protein product [Kuraishia capsulata CBS 1993]